MKRLSIAVALAALVCAAGVATTEAQGQGQGNQGQGGPPPVAEPPMAGIQWARGAARPGGGGGSPLLIYNGGPIMSTGAYVEPIFWGPRWNNASFAGDKMTGLRSFYADERRLQTTNTSTQAGGAMSVRRDAGLVTSPLGCRQERQPHVADLAERAAGPRT